LTLFTQLYHFGKEKERGTFMIDTKTPDNISENQALDIMQMSLDAF